MGNNKAAQSGVRVVVLGTGGTISGRASQAGEHLGYRVGDVVVSELIDGIDVPGVALVAEQVANIDSKDMEHAVWRDLARRCMHWLVQEDVSGVVITHGTDTVEETAFFLQQALQSSKPVVLTCAMRPASALMPDGPQNIRDAIAVAAAPGARGVLVVCAGTVHAATEVQKLHTYRLDAFSSGDAGVVGHVEAGRLRQMGNWPPAPEGIARAAIEKIATADAWPRVEIVYSHVGAGAGIVDSLVRERLEHVPGAARGIVVAATGNGTVHRTLEAALLRARDAGIAVVRATRCAFGHVVPGAAHALPDAGALTPVKARIALMLSLMDARNVPTETPAKG